MKNDRPPSTPKPKRTTGDGGPTFVGPLVETFTQIDAAKRELDKRFVMKSDVLRDNKDCK